MLLSGCHPFKFTCTELGIQHFSTFVAGLHRAYETVLANKKIGTSVKGVNDKMTWDNRPFLAL